MIEAVCLDWGEREAGLIKKSESWDSKSEQRGSLDGTELPIAHTNSPKQEADKGWASLNPLTQNLHPLIKM